MMKFGKKLLWYLKQGLDVTGQGLEENGQYFGHVLRLEDNFLILALSSSEQARRHGSQKIAIDSSVWGEYRVVEPA